MPLEAFFVNLKKVKAIANVTKIAPKRVSVLEQDTIQSRCVRQTSSMDQSFFFILTAAIANECVTVVLGHCRSSRRVALHSCIRKQDPEQSGPCHSTETCPPLHKIGSKMEPWTVSSGELKLSRRDGHKDNACILGHGNPVRFDPSRWASSIDSSVATNKVLFDVSKAQTLKNGIKNLARSAAFVRFKLKRILARETSCLRCKKTSAPRKLPLGATGIKIQGPLRMSASMALMALARRWR